MEKLGSDELAACLSFTSPLFQRSVMTRVDKRLRETVLHSTKLILKESDFDAMYNTKTQQTTVNVAAQSGTALVEEPKAVLPLPPPPPPARKSSSSATRGRKEMDTQQRAEEESRRKRYREMMNEKEREEEKQMHLEKARMAAQVLADFHHLVHLELWNFAEINDQWIAEHIISNPSLYASIQTLSIVNCKVSRPIFHIFPALRHLSLSGNLPLEDLTQVKAEQLESLDISKTLLPESSLKKIFTLFPHLRTLNISQCKNMKLERLSPSEIKEITPGLEGLRSLDISNLSVTDSALNEILLTTAATLRKLQAKNCLRLKNLEILAYSLENISLEECSNLRSLKIVNGKSREGSQSSGHAFSSSLKTLNLSFTEIDHHDLIDILSEHASSLAEVIVNDCSSVSQFPPEALKVDQFPAMPKLKSLALRGSGIHSGKLISLLQKKMPSLEELDISFLSSLTMNPSHSSAIAEYDSALKAKRLRKLNVSGTLLTDEDLQCIVSLFPSLQDLKLINCASLAAPQCLNQLQQLETLDLSRTLITAGFLNTLAPTLPKIRNLILNQCHHIEDMALHSDSLVILNCQGIRNVRHISLTSKSLEHLNFSGFSQFITWKVNVPRAKTLVITPMSLSHSMERLILAQNPTLVIVSESGEPVLKSRHILRMPDEEERRRHHEQQLASLALPRPPPSLPQAVTNGAK